MSLAMLLADDNKFPFIVIGLASLVRLSCVCLCSLSGPLKGLGHQRGLRITNNCQRPLTS